MLLLTAVVVGLIEVHNGLAVLDVGGLHAVNRGDGQGAGIGAGRANRTGVGVGGQRQVAVGVGAVGGVVAVGGGHHHGDAGLTDAVVHTAEQLLLTLVRETAGGTQGHIDDVHAQDDAILQSGQNPGAHSGILNVGEDLHRHQLSVGSHAGDDVVLAHDDTGHVGAVVVVGGVHIGVVICVIVTERNLIIDEDVVHGQVAVRPLVGGGLVHQSGHLVVGQTQLVRGEVVGGESGVVGVQTGVQNRHHHTGTVVIHAGGVEDTRLVDVHLILHQLGIHRLILLADGRGLGSAQRLTGDGIIATLNLDLKAAEEGIVILTQLVFDPLLSEQGQQLRLTGLNGVGDRLGLVGEGILLQRHGLVGAVVGIHQGGAVHADDDRDVVILLDPIGQFEGYVAVEIIQVIHQEGILVQLIDAGDLQPRQRAARHLGRKHRRDRAHQQGHSQQYAEYRAQDVGEMCLLHT